MATKLKSINLGGVKFPVSEITTLTYRELVHKLKNSPEEDRVAVIKQLLESKRKTDIHTAYSLMIHFKINHI